MNVLDQFMTHRLKARYYLRYADDILLLSRDRDWLCRQLPAIRTFLQNELHLILHPKKIFLQTSVSGVDFLGWVHFPCHAVLRTATKRRMFRRIKEHPTPDTLQSYLGLLSHGNAFNARTALLNGYWLWRD